MLVTCNPNQIQTISNLKNRKKKNSDINTLGPVLAVKQEKRKEQNENFLPN